MRAPSSRGIRDGLFITGVLSVIGATLVLSITFDRFPQGIAVALDLLALLVVVGKAVGRRLGLSLPFFQSPPALRECIVLVVVLVPVNLAAFLSPVIVESAGAVSVPASTRIQVNAVVASPRKIGGHDTDSGRLSNLRLFP
jgi:hypothetical protein